MKPDTSHIKQIKVVSNTHWDREFRRSFEKTRRRLITMMDKAIDILEKDPEFKSFTLDGHSVMVDDYLEMRPEKREVVTRLIGEGRLVIGPWFSLPEEFTIGHESLVRNFLKGKQNMEKYGAKPVTVAYTPSSWGQTGQLPQILRNFGLDKMMFYRGISHHEADAEYMWAAPDGTEVFASRFAMFARYNWYYLVHRPVTTGRSFQKDYQWGEYDEAGMRIADGLAGEDLSFDVQDPALPYSKETLKDAVEKMIEAEGRHFTTEVFLAMNGHDISAPHPLEPQVVKDAAEIFKGKYKIEQATLEEFWEEALKHLDRDAIAHLKGERRSYLKEGLWTYLFPGTISARTYLKLADFDSTQRIVYSAEPMAVLGAMCGADYPKDYLQRGWDFLIDNHTHDANGGCAPDAVCLDMEQRYRKASDCADIVTEDMMAHVVKNLSPEGLDGKAIQLVVFNPLPVERDVTAYVDVEVPREMDAKAVKLTHADDENPVQQPISNEKSSCFVDSIWEVPRILESNRIRFYARFNKLPACGYRVYQITGTPDEVRTPSTLVVGSNRMANELLDVTVNGNGTLTVTNKMTGKTYSEINYFTDQGECGNAWKHDAPTYDRTYNSLGVQANVAVSESGPLRSSITADFEFKVPLDYADGSTRSDILVGLPVKIEYSLEAGKDTIGVKVTVDNKAKDHWLRVALPSGIQTDVSYADSHFDVVERAVEIPDSTGWVEQAFGTHPLRTFAGLSDGTDGLAVMPKGLFEYEVCNDAGKTFLLTLIRACRIKLAVSEEKVTELPDEGIQCPGVRTFEYGICIHEGDWRKAKLLTKAAGINTPLRMVVAGRGKGELDHSMSAVQLDNELLHVSAIKKAEDGCGLIVRLFNPDDSEQSATLTLGREMAVAKLVQMDESTLVEELPMKGNTVSLTMPSKKIFTVRFGCGCQS
ncbi:glycoside hydrolase family 38 C-terminal domain-containing protein [Coraliomargarita parva]|uniref:glycoside hydrolase family 38 N-terminal domain-containing protein n=1 Tax=Coraliomargarita parva TaxID=3014050 RepID=UPI0022B519A4|nr:glycoside hydrolase family 38 C-terminal domain-containing protein [Coraliomargarita parva]